MLCAVVLKTKISVDDTADYIFMPPPPLGGAGGIMFSRRLSVCVSVRPFVTGGIEGFSPNFCHHCVLKTKMN